MCPRDPNIQHPTANSQQPTAKDPCLCQYWMLDVSEVHGQVCYMPPPPTSRRHAFVASRPGWKRGDALPDQPDTLPALRPNPPPFAMEQVKAASTGLPGYIKDMRRPDLGPPAQTTSPSCASCWGGGAAASASVGGLCPSVVRKGGVKAAAGEAGSFVVVGEVLQEFL